LQGFPAAEVELVRRAEPGGGGRPRGRARRRPRADYSWRSAYVVFGKASTDTLDLRAGAETTPPKLVLGGSRSQHVVRQRGVIVTASCNEACTLKASGAITVLEATIPLRPAATNLPSGQACAIASITVRAADKGSNKSTAKRSVAVRR
jgi:hypothetical protein